MKPKSALQIPSSSLLSTLLLFSTFTSYGAADIPLDSALYASTPSQTWASPSAAFSVGFTAASASSAHYAVVARDGLPVWTAGGSSPGGGASDAAASLRLLPDGNLRLANGSSGAVVWQSGTAGRGVSSAALDDSGNLVLLNGTVPVWSTFDNPTNTILPSQNFTTSKTLRSGLYSFRLLSSGNLTLNWNDSIVYWNSGLNSSINANLTSPSLGFQIIGILSLYDRTLPSSVVMAYSSDYAEGTDVFRFLRLDSDGNLRIYSSAQGSENSTEGWAAVANQCQIFGYCGNFGICRYNDTGPVCECPSMNFEPVDAVDSRKGCRRKVKISDCPGREAMLQLDHAEIFTYPPELVSHSTFQAISACRLNCLVSGSCIASTSLSDGTGVCYQRYPEDFVSGYHSPALPSTSFVKVCDPVVENPSPSSVGVMKGGNSSLHAWMIVVAVVGSIAGMVMLEGGLWWWCCRNRPKLSAAYALIEYASGAPVQFSYKELQRATKGFREKLGAGGFGAVYRGVIADNKIVAVKQLEGIEQGEKQFRMEVATISSTHHLNLVRLIGFCSEGRHRLLVYEFMKNRSLDGFLFTTDEEESSGKSFGWECRFKIALGTAKGITYLHEECRDCIVHCDIKPENILLDETYNAKVSDFGLAKLVNPKDHRGRTLTSVRGTRGYLAPEWLANLPITSKSDIYSYGMVLLELVSGRRNFEVSIETNLKKFSIWAYEEFEKGNVKGIVDKRLSDCELDMEQVMRAIQVSFWCIQEQPNKRPMMGKVVQMLQGIIEIEKPPPPKAAATEGSSSRGTSLNISAGPSLPSSLPTPERSFLGSQIKE